MIARLFNANLNDAAYNAQCDLNLDGAINLSDIVIIAKHFNSSASSYVKVI
ncbi:MAG TPA: hypothetical protein VIO64_20060 [Pseudobacteroides sp.]|uniref:hypothetical protein n=1 Tax=Pseudobacteroides sp. TaxID=1968840 RepID=UPI002F9489FE